MTKLNYFISGIILLCIISGCSDRNGDDPGKKTNSGYVAFDYTCYSFRKYIPLLKEIYQFNEYVKQPTLAKRDSVDRLYFRNIKIFYDEPQDVWTLRTIQTYYTDFSAISIHTNGKSLNETGAVWTISGEADESSYAPFRFYVEGRENNGLHITEHTLNMCDVFEYTTEWDAYFEDDGKSCTLKGSGTLLSIRSPKLKLQYTITEPMKIVEDYGSSLVSSGTVNISATDIDKNLVEEISSCILSNEMIEITYGNHIENWNYSIF